MTINIAIVGKPNVGKSTFFNKIFGSNISKVANEPGTTKQVIDKILKVNNLELRFYDTGGLKKKSKSNTNNQSYITKECLGAINKSTIVIFMMDANDHFTKNDKQICRMILNKLKTLIVIVNKSDLVKNQIKIKTKYFNYYFENLFSDILIKPYFFSSISKRDTTLFIDLICKLENNLKTFIDNKQLNTFLSNINNSHKAPLKGNFRPRIKFLKQVNSNPLILKAFGTRLVGINRDYKNFFIKKFLSYFNILNRVVIVKFINNENPFN